MIEASRTQHVTQYAWRMWKSNGIPDLSPGSVEGSLLLTIGDATEMAASDLISSMKQRATGDGVAYAGPETLYDLHKLAFQALDQQAMKMLKKVFDTVMKHYYTIVFSDPTEVNPDFLAYASPAMYYDLEALVRQQAPLDVESQLTELQARMQRMKGNACKKLSGSWICGQPVSGRTICAFWEQPEEGNRYQCYYQERNPNQIGMADGFLCQCGDAWKDKEGAEAKEGNEG